MCIPLYNWKTIYSYKLYIVPNICTVHSVPALILVVSVC